MYIKIIFGLVAKRDKAKYLAVIDDWTYGCRLDLFWRNQE